jgi:hypothetical protein
VWSLAAGILTTLILLSVLVFPRLLRPGISAEERAALHRQGAAELITAEDDRSNAQNNIRTTLLQGIAGVALLTGAYFAYRGLEAGRLQLDASREGQITTRYTEAVKQLGDEEHVDVRLGGIYALERIARDSDRDAPAVMALLCAFVRRARAFGVRAARPPHEPPPGLSVAAPDVQIALTVLVGLRLPDQIKLFHADLTGVDFTGADLSNAELHGANLDHAILTGADLTRTNLTRADVTNPRGADLSGTGGTPSVLPD